MTIQFRQDICRNLLRLERPVKVSSRLLEPTGQGPGFRKTIAGRKPAGQCNSRSSGRLVSVGIKKEIEPGRPIPHFNEGDMGSGVPQVLMRDIYLRKGMAPETTLHDVRWGREYDGKFVWVLLISGAAPPAHFGGWKKTIIHRQPAMYFPKGGG